jgi:uncharacterized protein (TIGR03085 family)
MSGWAAQERRELVALFRSLGPDAPTECGDWTTAELAAHLYVRERRPDAAVGIVGGPAAGYTERTMRSVLRVHSYDHVVDRIAAGPPLPLKLLDEQINLHEFFVHHEDVRRANGQGPRELDPDFEKLLWSRLKRMLRLAYRNAKGVQLEFVTAHGDRTVIGSSGPTARLYGPVGELVLYSFNRKGVSQVELTGDADAIESVRTARLGV